MGFKNQDLTPLIVTIKFNGNVLFAQGPINQVPGTPGYIQYNSQAWAGPNVLGPGGYPPLTFVPLTAGDYDIEFTSSVLELFDISVIDTTVFPLAAVDGRLWSKSWAYNTGSLSPSGYCFSTNFVLTDDSIVTSIYYNKMQGHLWDAACNSNGCFPPPAAWDTSCKSRPGGHRYPQYKIFVNDPDPVEFPTGILGSVIPGSFTVTSSCDGLAHFSFSVNKPGNAQVYVNVNPLPGQQPEDVMIMGAVTPGLNTFTWNTLNGLGVPVTNGDSVDVYMEYINGLTNFPVFDVEQNFYGLIVQLVRPAGPPIATYWNDTLLANKGGRAQLTGCFSSMPENGCHKWTGNYGGVGLGSLNTVNTWWYAASSKTQEVKFRVKRPPGQPGGLSGPTILCQSISGTVYSIDPSPVSDADPNGFEWILTQVSTGIVLFDSVNKGSSITIPFASFPPGDKRLKVRGHNSICGYGAFGPGAAGEGILIRVNPAPQVSNPVTTSSVCTGMMTNILLTSTMMSTNFSYTATATSTFVTGYSGGNQNPIQQTLINSGNGTDTVIYKVVPYAAGCNGDTVNFYVKVSPQPVVTNTTTEFTQCTGGTTTIVLQSNFTQAVFNWSASSGSGSITGYYNSSGPVIAQPLQNTGTSPGTVTYLVVPEMAGCQGAAKTFTITVNPGSPVSVTISGIPTVVCSGAPVTLTAIPVNGGFTPSFQWKVNGVIAGTNNPVFTYIPSNNDIVTCIMNSTATNCTTNNPATSPPVTVTVDPNLPVSISISASSNPFCLGSAITFTATPVNGGLIPGYQWKVNAINVINATNAVFSYAPVNGDVVTCSLLSSETCTSGNPAQSNPVTMVVNANLPAGITIAASSNPFCPGSAITFTATPINGGSNPGYQWKVNAVNAINANNAVFSYVPANGDTVTCQMTSNLSCVTGNPASSARIIMIGSLAPNVAFSACFDTVTTVNAKPFQLKGGLPIGGTYSGPGVNSSTGIFTPSIAGIGIKTINYSYINVHDCGASKSKSIVVQPYPSFTCGANFVDTRDNKVYPTVQIGTQCWMSKNLDFGLAIASTIHQADNCIAEKYCYNGSVANCTQYGGLYQWDEMMKFDDSPAGQGLCPPGWHVPTEADWTTLMNYYLGNGRAGRPLQDTVINGFKALRSGVFYLNSSWSFLDFATILWSSTSSGQTKAISHGMNLYNFSVSLYPASRANAFPVRCLRD